MHRWGVGILAAMLVAGGAIAQPALRRATSPAALITYPGFFQGQPVVVSGTLVSRDKPMLTSPSTERAIPLLFMGPSPADGPVELRATFWDVGRLQPEDPRLATAGLLDLVPRHGDETDWPRPGQLLVLVVSDAMAAKPAAATPSLRLIAMSPDLYVGKKVTVSGQFRGRNLFGDIPQAPNISRWDFVLHNGDGAVWVTGLRPRGKGFNLDVNARVDTREWLEVTGTVRTGKGIVWIEAAPPITLAKPDTSFVTEALPPPPMGPRPEVIFSDPQEGDIDVPLNRTIRLQFSRDMNPDSFKGNVHWRYSAPSTSSELPQNNLSLHYEQLNRSLEVKVTAAESLTRFRALQLSLDDAITATDGAKLEPFTMTFTFGDK